MVRGKDLVPNGVDSDGENSRSKVSQQYHDFVHGKKVGVDEFQSSPTKVAISGLQELTLSYLCDNPKLGLVESGIGDRSLVKGKEIVVCGNSDQDEKASTFGGARQCLEHDCIPRRIVVGNQNHDQDEKWVERDFLSLSESRENSSKRSIEEECNREKNGGNKQQKLETLGLSLALPDVSLSLTASNALKNGDQVVRPKASRQSARTTTTINSCSNDYTGGASLSQSYSHPFSHNPSCSLTRNSTENFEYSLSKDDQIWHCGEGTNGSVHSRFKPIGDGVAFANHSFMQGNSHYKATSSDNQSFYPSELPARVRFEAQSEGSRGKNSENLRGLEGMDGGKMMKFSTSERVLREIVSDSIPAMALTFQEFTDEAITSIKEHLKGLIDMPNKKGELENLQNRLGRRSDLTREILSKCHKDQLEILVAIKMGLGSFLSGDFQFLEMVEVFFHKRCRNVNCKSLLPVDDCDCKMCSTNKGFCSSCMCPVCFNFDCASNTCSWVGCDVCSHWCHAACAIQRNLIKPGPSLKGPSGTSEVQFHCIGCGHASEMFGFVKDVFVCCAKEWSLETLIKELGCVRRIFQGSEDRKGKELHIKTDDMLLKLQAKLVSPLDACNYIVQFFSYADGMSDFPASGISSKDLSTSKANLPMDTTSSLPQSISLIPKYTHDMSYSRLNDLQQRDIKTSLPSEHTNETDFHFEALLRKEGFESLESIVRIKEAEARMFQSKADEARREAEGFQKMIKTKAAQMEEEYAERLGKLCLHEAEERRKKKFEELNVLQSSHYDYFNMKSRMQDEIHGLLKRMEATKQQ
ncbi:protein OBERON 3 [Cajanus cajan]|uniref:protein OBERON 3 n=1 Tax=Cajanus cajan TaxID=3821 RepID=UPI00098DB72A|nr:protein OBERON 3 [Cajanus cajan]